MAGTDYDYLELLNFGSAVNLANLTLTLTNSQSGMQTNWFLTCNAGFINEFSQSNIVLGGMAAFGMVYDTASNRVGIWFVPEPGVCLLALLSLLPLRHRRY